MKSYSTSHHSQRRGQQRRYPQIEESSSAALIAEENGNIGILTFEYFWLDNFYELRWCGHDANRSRLNLGGTG